MNKQEIKDKLTLFHRKLNSCDLRHLYGLNYCESIIRTANFGIDKKTGFDPIESYIEFERTSEALDEVNERHNYGRLVIVPLDTQLLSSGTKENQKKILHKAISTIAFVPEYKNNVKFFAGIEADKLMIVLIERCLLKKQGTPKVQGLKSFGFGLKGIMIVQNELTRLSRLFEYRCNLGKDVREKIDGLYDKIDSNESGLLKTIFAVNISEFSYRTYRSFVEHHPLLKKIQKDTS